MFKEIWQKIKQNHMLMMMICCLIPIVLFVGFFSLFKDSNYWIWLVILFCPLMHFFMIGKHNTHNSKIKEKTELYQCFECGLKYQEKEWAEKCESWCKKYKSCNLEIIKHSVKNLNHSNN